MILSYRDKTPKVDESAHLAEGVHVIGDVEIGADASVWFGSVIRGDVNSIRIGARSNIQDLTVIHVDHGKFPTIVETDVTVGHRAILHGCHVKKGALIGMGAILLNGAVVEEQALVAAGALVSPGSVLPARTLSLGVPAKPMRELTDDELAELVESAEHYRALKDDYRKQRGS